MNKPRLIDANKLLDCIEETYLKRLHEDHGVPFNLIHTLINEQPTVDVVEVVRCEDCTIHNKCVTEDVFKFTGVKNPFCCAGKKVQDD